LEKNRNDSKMQIKLKKHKDNKNKKSNFTDFMKSNGIQVIPNR